MRAEPLDIDCAHGNGVAAVVCCHHVGTATPRGFIENNDDPVDLQAWCHDCEAVYLREQALTPLFVKFNDFKMVCTVCYEAIKAKHLIGTDD
jgi:hypothetical protein